MGSITFTSPFFMKLKITSLSIVKLLGSAGRPTSLKPILRLSHDRSKENYILRNKAELMNDLTLVDCKGIERREGKELCSNMSMWSSM